MAALFACGRTAEPDDRISVPYPEVDTFDPAAVEAGRRDTSWRGIAERDRRARRARTGASTEAGETIRRREARADTLPSETFEDITPGRVNSPVRVPRDMEAGPTIARLQVLLDRAGFSPGVIDGIWGRNTEAALYWFQETNDLTPSGEPDRRVLELLAERAGDAAAIGRYRLTEEDLRGPFLALPSNVYEQANLECLCYRSAAEQLAERFHTTGDFLAQLNPGVDLSELARGMELFVPNVGAEQRVASGSGAVTRIIVSREGRYMHAVDSRGDIVYHFPTTIGAAYSPSPTGDLHVTKIVLHPPFHYQPNLLPHVPSHEPSTLLPPGPNSPVGVVWMQLSRPHYGIHGTDSPSTIGYASSAGCVRLTNWDVVFLSERVEEGTPVEFPS